MMIEALFSGSDNFIGTSNSVSRLRDAILAIDWDQSPAGPISHWSMALRATVRTMLYAASPMAVMIGREGIVVCNDAAREIFGDAWQEAQGKPIFHALPIASNFYREKIDDAYRGISHRLKDQPIRLIRDGVAATCWFNLGLSPIIDDDGKVFGMLMAASETTLHVRTRQALTLAHQRVEAALEAGGIVGTWDFDTRSRRVIIDGALAAQYDISTSEAQQGLPLESLFEHLHEEDRKRVRSTIKEAARGGHKMQTRFRTIKPDRTIQRYVASGRPIIDDDGGVSGFAGIVVDTTDQAEAAAALQASNLRFETLVEAIPQIVWSSDRHGNHDFFNQRWTEFTGIEAEQNTHSLWSELIHPDDRTQVQEVWSECLQTGKLYDLDYRFKHQRDGYRWLRVIALPMRDAEGNIERWYGTSTDIEDAKLLETERKLVNRELDHRIGNLFALVNGLVNFSAREEPQSSSFASNLKGRLSALHKAHRRIRESEGTIQVPLRQLLNETLAPYAAESRPVAEISGPDLLIRPQSVSTFAIVFHELATNSAKYGAFASPDGRLVITVCDDGQTVEIDWTEHIPDREIDIGSKDGFGSTLLTAIVERQWQGAFERELTLDGLRIALRLPRDMFVAVEDM